MKLLIELLLPVFTFSVILWIMLGILNLPFVENLWQWKLLGSVLILTTLIFLLTFVYYNRKK